MNNTRITRLLDRVYAARPQSLRVLRTIRHRLQAKTQRGQSANVTADGFVHPCRRFISITSVQPACQITIDIGGEVACQVAKWRPGLRATWLPWLFGYTLGAASHNRFFFPADPITVSRQHNSCPKFTPGCLQHQAPHPDRPHRDIDPVGFENENTHASSCPTPSLYSSSFHSLIKFNNPPKS